MVRTVSMVSDLLEMSCPSDLLATLVVFRPQQRRCAATRQPGTSPCTCWRPAPSATCRHMLPPCCAQLPAQRQPAKRALKLRRGIARLQLAH